MNRSGLSMCGRQMTLAGGTFTGARSLPLNRIGSPPVFDRPGSSDDPLYVVSEDDAAASIGALALRGRGWRNPVVVKGGMREWVAEGLPVDRAIVLRPVGLYLSALTGLAAILALATNHFLVSSISLVATLATSLGTIGTQRRALS